MVYILCYDKNEKLQQIEFKENHFIFENHFVQLLDLTQPIHISYEVLSYFKDININHGLTLNEIINIIEMLSFDSEFKKILVTPFIHSQEYENTDLLKYFDEFDIYLFLDDQLKHFLDYLI